MHKFDETMRSACTAAVAVVFAMGLGACKRESDTVVMTPPPAAPSGAASSSSTTSTSTVVQPTPHASTAQSAASGTASAPAPSESMARLQLAAQRLREAVQAMAQEPAGDRRNTAIKQGNEALIEINQAMTSLPPDMRAAGSAVGTTPSAGGAGSVALGPVYPNSDVEYTKAMDRLQKAAQQLREAIQAMAQEPAGPRRDDAIKSANKALVDTQQSMIQLPPEMRSAAK